jgi:enamine deaminase RidA (YjgF/YER057c/UK114 family)
MVKAVSEYLKGAVEVPSSRTLVVVGAQVPVDGRKGTPEDIAEQAALVWAGVRDALAEKHLETRHIVAIETDLADRADLAAAAEEEKRHVRHHVARTVRIVGMADPAWRIQVSVVAAATR